MLYFIFAYNIFLIVLYTIAATAFFISYMRRREPVDGWIALLFALFIIDNSMIYMTEIIANASGIFSNTVKILILCSFLLCYGQTFKYLCRSRFTRIDYICYAVFVAATFSTPPSPDNRLAAWLYLAYVWMMLGYVLSRAYYEAKKSSSAYPDRKFLKIKPVYVAGMAFITAAMLENGIKVFSGQETLLGATKVYTRNISEDLYSIYIVGLALWYLSEKTFRAASTTESPDAAPIPESPDVVTENAPELENQLDAFARHYKITPRESEILKLLVIGYTNQQISEALFISLGTVKNHAHNIYQKCEVTKRSQLLRLLNNRLPPA